MTIKVDVISGFLGSGKTTLIRKLLPAHAKEKVVLIENEFGEIGIDGELVERDGFDVFAVSNGCICCIMQKDFVQMLGRVVASIQPERIIIEPTGLSILSEIIEILNRPEFASSLQINSLVTVVDSVNYLEQCEAFGEFFTDQIANASVLILSKSQLVNGETLDKITASLRQLNPNGQILSKPWYELGLEDLNKLLDLEMDIDFSDILYTEYKPCSENEFDTLALAATRAYSWEELDRILSLLSQTQYGNVLRGKGFLKSPQGFLDFSYTNGQFIITESKFQSSGKLCLIGKKLKQQAIKELFESGSGVE